MYYIYDIYNTYIYIYYICFVKDYFGVHTTGFVAFAFQVYIHCRLSYAKTCELLNFFDGTKTF